MTIIKQAQQFLKENNVDQWQGDYPNTETIINDVAQKIGYVLVHNEKIVGTVAVSFDGEETYNTIYDGKWKSNEKYAVVHRIAIHNDCRGMDLATTILKNIEQMCLREGIHSIKIDTHKKNLAMQKLMQKNNFEYCGIIYLADGSERIAFEKLL